MSVFRSLLMKQQAAIQAVNFVSDSGSFTLTITSTGAASALRYSVDSGATWTDVTVASGGTQTITGKDILLNGSDNTMTPSSSIYLSFKGSAAYKVSGELMKLFGYDTPGQYQFYNMFKSDANLTDASGLVMPNTSINQCYYMFYGCTGLTAAPELPATKLAGSCYQSMFYGCTGLTAAPELPATKLANYCYHSMFRGCTGLTSAPTLPATTLAISCYSYMFYGCTGLTAAPELPATTLASSCYQSMFYGCKKLNYIKALFTTDPGSSYTNYWVYGVASTGTFVKSVDATWDVTGANGVPTGWTVKKDGEEETAEANVAWSILNNSSNDYDSPVFTLIGYDGNANEIFSIETNCNIPLANGDSDDSTVTWNGTNSALLAMVEVCVGDTLNAEVSVNVAGITVQCPISDGGSCGTIELGEEVEMGSVEISLDIMIID